jgi:hypothetical protein
VYIFEKSTLKESVFQERSVQIFIFGKDSDIFFQNQGVKTSKTHARNNKNSFIKLVILFLFKINQAENKETQIRNDRIENSFSNQSILYGLIKTFIIFHRSREVKKEKNINKNHIKPKIHTLLYDNKDIIHIIKIRAVNFIEKVNQATNQTNKNKYKLVFKVKSDFKLFLS